MAKLPPQFLKNKKTKKGAKAPMTAAKAKKILKDGTLDGKPLTPKQKKFFGMIAGKK